MRRKGLKTYMKAAIISACFIFIVAQITQAHEFPFGVFASSYCDNPYQIDSCGFNQVRWNCGDSLSQDELNIFSDLGMKVIVHNAYSPIFYYASGNYSIWEAEKSPEFDSTAGMDVFYGTLDTSANGCITVMAFSSLQIDTLVISGPRGYAINSKIYQHVYYWLKSDTTIINYTTSFRMKGCDSVGIDTIAKIQIIAEDSTLRSLFLFDSDDHTTYKEFPVNYTLDTSKVVVFDIKYQMFYYGGDTIWIDKVILSDVRGGGKLVQLVLS